ncbi:MAG TPA: excalibur calcium-binding domain-containing protein [Candidatus Limnocylindrales bacterium]
MKLRARRPARAAWTAAALLAASITFLLPANASAAQDEAATIKTEANLRTEPNTTSEIEAVLPQGTSIRVVCWAEGEPTFGTDKFGSMWLYLSQDGWVHSRLVSPVDVPPCSGNEDGIVLYDNCDDARDHLAAPVRIGEPGYGLHLDRDRDGVGCESN